MTTGCRLLAAISLLNASGAWALKPDLSDLSGVPLKMVQAPLAKSIELAETRKSQPYQFAVGAPLTVTLYDGLWDQVDSEHWRWRIQLSSPGAESLNFELSRFHLPAAAELWIYDAEGQLVQGPYTAADETPEGRLWTAVVLGPQAVLELRVPNALRDQVDLELATVNHGFRGFGKAGSSVAKSGSCNIDVVCPQGDDWRDEIRSVARIEIGGQFLCTGQLVNNTSQNNDPLFITANHCEIGQTAGTPASSVIFYWNYFNSSCRPASGTTNRSGDGSLAMNQTGSTLLARDANADFTLLRLSQAPQPSFDVHFAGWNAGNSVPQSGVAIHHPSGDEKSISLFNSPATRIAASVELNAQAWRVTYAQGTTEGGSSGGALWDQNHRMVGWLSEGTALCSNPEGYDDFGRMEIAWNTNPASARQLEVWLAPGNTGKLSIAGRDPGDPGSLSLVNDAFVTTQGAAAGLLNVLANDSGSNLTLATVGTPSQGGSATISGNQILYQPAASFSGTETLGYSATNADADIGTATVQIQVTAAPSPGGGGGGGSVSPGWLLILAAAILRRRLAIRS
jgi:hypothetical protein